MGFNYKKYSEIVEKINSLTGVLNEQNEEGYMSFKGQCKDEDDLYNCIIILKKLLISVKSPLRILNWIGFVWPRKNIYMRLKQNLAQKNL